MKQTALHVLCPLPEAHKGAAPALGWEEGRQTLAE